MSVCISKRKVFLKPIHNSPSNIQSRVDVCVRPKPLQPFAVYSGKKQLLFPSALYPSSESGF